MTWIIKTWVVEFLKGVTTPTMLAQAQLSLSFSFSPFSPSFFFFLVKYGLVVETEKKDLSETSAGK